MTHISLYPDQSDLVARVQKAMPRYKSILLQSATGSGKTRIALHMMDRIRLKGNRCGFVVPRRELLRQTIESAVGFGLPYGVLAAGHKPSPFTPIQLMTAGTLARRLDKAPKLSVVFIDEAHFGGAELSRIIQHYKATGAWVIGLSATPMKTNGQGMGEWYDVMIEGPSIRWLMDNERLSDYRLFAPDTPDLSSLKVTNGDYVQKDVDGYMMSDERGKVLVGNAAKHYREHAYGKLNVSFCTSIKAAEMTAQMFRDKGIPSAAVSGKTEPDELKRVIKAFARREILNITNAQLLAFGFDLSQASGIDVTIESMSDLSPTKSLPWQMQKNGRVLRMKDDPALIFDHVGNAMEHGLPDGDREWTLESRDKRKRGDVEKTEPTRQCSECFFVHRPSPTCPNCGYVYPVMSREIDEVDGELVEVTEIAPKRNVKQEVGIIARKEGLRGLIDYANENGYSRGWAIKQMQVRGLPIR